VIRVVASTNAERQKRYREHKAGRHHLCIPGNCKVVTPRNELPPAKQIVSGPQDLGVRGRELHEAVLAEWKPGPLHRQLLLECCRLADRLDQLDRYLDGGDWLRFHASPSDDSKIYVVLDKALTETRETVSAFRQAVETLAKAQRESTAGKQEPSDKPDVLNEIAKKMAERAARAGKVAG